MISAFISQWSVANGQLAVQEMISQATPIPQPERLDWQSRTSARCCELGLLRQQGLALDVPGKMVDGAAGSQNSGAAGGKREPHQAMAGDLKRGLRILGQPDDAAFSAQGGGHIQITIYVQGQTLRASQTAIKHGNAAVRINAINGIEAGGGGSGDKQVAADAEGHVVGGDTGLQRREYKNLPVTGNFEDS